MSLRLPLLLALVLGVNEAHAVQAQNETPGEAPAASIEDEKALDWVLTEVPDRKATLAVAQFDVGLTIATRCVDGLFEATLHGLPEATGTTRPLQITLGDNEPYESLWIVGTNKTAAFSRVPVRFARGLAKGGVLQIRVPANGGKPATRYVLDLPPSVSAIEQTLVACNKSMVDLRYATMADEEGPGLPEGIEWLRPPSPNFPLPIGQTMSTQGFVTISCGVSTALKPEDCQIESEYPAGFNFGREILRSMPRSQLKLTNPEVPLRQHTTILFNVNFRFD